jgi:hypothetical protein
MMIVYDDSILNLALSKNYYKFNEQHHLRVLLRKLETVQVSTSHCYSRYFFFDMESILPTAQTPMDRYVY